MTDKTKTVASQQPQGTAPQQPEVEKLEKIEHENIIAALAAFQGENLSIARTKEFGKEGEKMHWWYAPLNEVLDTVRPYTSRHGLAFTWEAGGNEGEIVCALYHDTYAIEAYDTERREDVIEPTDRSPREVTRSVSTRTKAFRETGVMRSAPISVARKGDMKAVGSDSTYARRYTLAEVLGIAPEEDNDVADMQERLENAEKFAFHQAKKQIAASDGERLTRWANYFEEDMKLLAEGKKGRLGLTKEQYDELQKLVVARRNELHKEKPQEKTIT